MSPIRSQRGSTLMVALIMLVLLTLIAVSAINSTSTSIQMVGNAQYREESTAVAQQAIEQMISSNFTTAPASAVISVDINNDGTADYTGQVAVPECTSSIALTNSQLNPLTNVADQTCVSSGASTPGPVGPDGKPSLIVQSWCSKQTWDISSTVLDSRTGANTTLHQGVYVRVPAGTACP